MKRVFTPAVVALLLLSPLASADLKTCMMAGSYAGYTLGFGDAFKSYEENGVKYSSGPNINFGGSFHYGVTDRLMIGGEV